MGGNIEGEVDEMMQVLCVNLSSIAPAFPKNKRITVNGYQSQWGIFYLGVPGKSNCKSKANPSLHRRKYIEFWRGIVIRLCEQYIIPPNTWHWF